MRFIFLSNCTLWHLLESPYQGNSNGMHNVPYFFAYKFFSFQNNSKNLDLSYKVDLDLWDCLGRVKLILQQNCIGLIWLFIPVLERTVQL